MIQPGIRLVLAIIFLLSWGITNALITAKMERRGYLEGFHWLAMATGAVTTVIGVAFIDLHSSALAAGALLISGTPMMIGEIWRYMRAREREQQVERQTPRVAE